MSASAIFNMVSVSGIQYADATADGTIPTTLKTINIVADGKFSPDFPIPSTTEEVDELTQQTFRVRTAPVSNKITVDLPQVYMNTLADFLGGTFTAGTAGTTPDDFLIAGATTVPTHKYVLITGLNNMGKDVKVTAYNTRVTASWTGAVGANQATIPLQVVFTLLQDNSDAKKIADFKGAF